MTNLWQKSLRGAGGGGARAGSKEEDFVDVCGEGGGGCFGSLVADKIWIFIKILFPREGGKAKVDGGAGSCFGCLVVIHFDF